MASPWVLGRCHSYLLDVFQGNRDRYNKVSRPLPTPVTSRYIRLYPAGYAGWVAMAMEVYVTNDENTWLKQEEYVPLGVGLDPDDPAAVPKIPDLHMTASSREAMGFFPWRARLNNGRGRQLGACWSPWEREFDRWLQIKHDEIYKVAGVITQGAYNADYWVTAYKLAFSLDGQRWTTYTNVTGDGEEVLFQGNSDNHRYARNLLAIPVFALYTRFYPYVGVPTEDGGFTGSYHGQIALRVEILVIDEIESQFHPCTGEDPNVFHYRQACDGREDCSTGKDEADCDGHWICDRIEDCADGEDEQGCVYGVPKHCFFTCRHNATCLSSRQLGDGRQDCAHGEDERPGDVEEALGREWGSCSYSCPSVYGNASCVPDAFWCDSDADCLGEEDEQGCGDASPMEDDGGTGDGGSTGGQATSSGYTSGQATTSGPTGQEATSEFTAGQTAISGSTSDQEAGGGPTEGRQREPTAEPTSGQESFEDNTVGEFHARSHGAQNQAVVWMTAAALGGQILYRLAF
uniref:F5/8 type C domain-containing protein n=1 Tax=Branchiostoma floridae TaxID=7739 RepID=C3Z0B9_BRAFL|eukprot:XP_002597955.1 hypothetical protein BRAFLDRAFT_79801 [Branchiostoma floridae]